MSDPIFNNDEIRDLLKHPENVLGNSKEVSHLWEGPTVPHDLLHAGSKIKLVNQLHEAAAVKMRKALLDICGEGVSVGFVRHDFLPAKAAATEASVDKNIVLVWSDTASGLKGLYQIDRSLFFALYGKILGASGVFARNGSLTRLEQAFLNHFIQPIADVLSQAWKSYGEWNFRIKEIIQQQKMVARLGWIFDCFRAHFKIVVNGQGEQESQEGAFAVLLPKDLLNAIGKDKRKDAEEDGEEKEIHDRQWSSAVHEAILSLPVSVAVDLGSIDVPLKTVIGLKPGDKLLLSAHEEHSTVFVRNRPMFRASIGTLGGRKAAQITSYKKGEVIHG